MAEFVDQVAMLLESAPADYAVATPPTMPPIDESATVDVKQCAACPTRTQSGPTTRVSSPSLSLIRPKSSPTATRSSSTIPDPDLDVPAGTTIVRTVPQPDPLLLVRTAG